MHDQLNYNNVEIFKIIKPHNSHKYVMIINQQQT